MATDTTKFSINMSIRDHKKLKREAERYGVTMKDLTLLALEPILYPHKEPNARTRKAMKEAEQKGGRTTYKSMGDLFEALGL
ncbi:hypothetical protein [Candidatus Neptunochlamydia vexilliferae]|uniref:Uncharacterized protein n=1 Tax=Candidatus Neptunichlamydia vexilliferae TaxID=1651774 RepID=A0ABS0AZC8_9BACT|nr:hypothetical protein [Candidatus Neptunochlamydia vexilliferae]MBF5059480.1 hypothetical protein [Candidatus Neptunochlamydia vexilliferae]